MRILALYGARNRILYPTCEYTQEISFVSRVSQSYYSHSRCVQPTLFIWGSIEGVLLGNTKTRRQNPKGCLKKLWKQELCSVTICWGGSSVQSFAGQPGWSLLKLEWNLETMTLDRGQMQQQTPEPEASGSHLSSQLCLHWCWHPPGHTAQPHCSSDSASLRGHHGHATIGDPKTAVSREDRGDGGNMPTLWKMDEDVWFRCFIAVKLDTKLNPNTILLSLRFVLFRIYGLSILLHLMSWRAFCAFFGSGHL